MMKRRLFIYAGIPGAVFITLLIVIIINTLRLPSDAAVPSFRKQPAPADGYIERLQQAIQYPTIAHTNADTFDLQVFHAFYSFLEDSFPFVFDACRVRLFHQAARLIELPGRNPELSPMVFLAHQDVVGAGDAGWTHPPFSGHNDGEYVWGRGTLDDKGSLMALLESLEMLTKEKKRPERTLIFAFGDDEETMGRGAQAMADYLLEAGIRPYAILDEGLALTRGVVPLAEKPVALIGIAEKGYASFRLVAQGDGGHSSTPANFSPVKTIAEITRDLQEDFGQSRLTEPVRAFIRELAPGIPWPGRILFANTWLFSPVLKSVYQQTPGGNALVSNTIAFTQLSAGQADNVIPAEAELIINIRILPGFTVDGIQDRLSAVAGRPGVSIERMEPWHDPSAVAPVGHGAYQQIASTVRHIFPDALVVPNLMLATSDSRFYSGLTNHIYRFAPYDLDEEAIQSIHGTNEKISIENYRRMIGFYYLLISDLCGFTPVAQPE